MSSAGLALAALLSVTPETSGRMEQWFREQVLADGFPGGAVVVVEGDRVVLSAAVGVADLKSGTPVTLDTAYCIGSVTKSFTATALLQLVEKGQVDLDAPVTRYLPWFRVADDGVGERITLRQLATHSSGLPTNSHAVVWQDEAAIRGSIDRAARALRWVHLSHPPGGVFEYANMNYVVLGRVVEEVSGLPWDRYMSERIFAPLGMTHATVHPFSAGSPCVATAYAPEFGLLVEEPLQVGDFMGPASNIVSTAPDLARFASAHLGAGATLLQPATLAEAHHGAVEKGRGRRYGLGWEEEPFHGTTLLYHGGTTGHAAGVFLLPEKNLGIVILLGAYSHFAKEHIGRGLAAIALGAAPAADGQGELASLLRRERGGMVLLALCPATLALPPLLRRRRRAPWGRRRRMARAAALVALAAAAWIAAFHLPTFIPELPLPFGLRGYVPQLVIIVAAVLCTATAWAVWALLRIRIE